MSPFVRPYAVRDSDREAAVSVLLILLALFTATFTGLPDTLASEVDFQTASAVARTGSPALGGTPEAALLHTAEGPEVVVGPDGGLYSTSAPGAWIGLLPGYAVGRALALLWPGLEQMHAEGGARSEYFPHLLAGWRNPLLGALTAFLMVLTARRLGMHRPAAWLAGIAYGTTTFAWAQARSTQPDVQATFLLFLAFHTIVKVRERFERLRAPRNHDLAIAGAALGGCLLTWVPLALAVGVVTVAGTIVIRTGHRRVARAYEGWHAPAFKTRPFQLAIFLAPLAVAVAGLAAMHVRRSGHPLDFGLELGLADGSAPLMALLALLVSPGRGLVWMAPGLLLVPFGLRAPDGRDLPLWTRTSLGVALACLAPIAVLRSWHGEWTFGPRFLLPMLPFAWLAFGFALEAPRRGLRFAAAALCCLGLLVQLPAALVDHTTHQDLAAQAAAAAWPEAPGDTEREREQARFHRTLWDPRFAAPWAHWRILRHRVAGLGEEFPIDDLFRLEPGTHVTPSEARRRGFRHLAWVDLAERLGGLLLPAALLCFLMLGAGVVLGLRALDRTRL